MPTITVQGLPVKELSVEDLRDLKQRRMLTSEMWKMKVAFPIHFIESVRFTDFAEITIVVQECAFTASKDIEERRLIAQQLIYFFQGFLGEKKIGCGIIEAYVNKFDSEHDVAITLKC